MTPNRTLVLIPARMAATRLPGKPLLDIAGLPMIVHVLRQAEKADIGRVAVATDTAEIAAVVARLRAAGAVILGKANLTEFANILAIDMPSGYSSLGGQVMAALMQVAFADSPAQVDEAKQVLADTRRSLYRILAEDAPPTDTE